MTEPKPADLISLDGSKLEGGGGLIRYSLVLSALLNRPIHIHSIRAKRPGQGGLRSEHTTAISTLTQLTSGLVHGNDPGSRELVFTPHVAEAKISSNLLLSGTTVSLSGSGPIFLLALLPYMLFSHLASERNNFGAVPAEFELDIRAGTICVMAPSLFYLQQVVVPTLANIGIGHEHLILKPDHEQGWHTQTTSLPGRMVVRIRPLSTPLPSFVLGSRGDVRKIQATAHVPLVFCEEMKVILRLEITESILNVNHDGNDGTAGVQIVVDVIPSVLDNHFHVLLVATTTAPLAYIGYEEMYPHKGLFPTELEKDWTKLATHLIRCCIRGLCVELRRGNAVDEHMEDFMTIYQALAVGFSSVVKAESADDRETVPELNVQSPAIKNASEYVLDSGSMHRQTSWWVVEQLTGIRPEVQTFNGRRLFGSNGLGLGST